MQLAIAKERLTEMLDVPPLRSQHTRRTVVGYEQSWSREIGNRGGAGEMIFLMVPKDLQQSPDYERMLEMLKQRHGEGSVAADRDLFGSAKEWRKSWKEVYGEADGLYILAREDGTVGARSVEAVEVPHKARGARTGPLRGRR